ncbi:MAG: DNA translocase FtsK 4TM domain-containing protein, partial [Actinomycetota bacterium]|nr:DNA translocase FtsK 4TM domain-containing protein [Actinomycetota bacterium]
MVTTARRRPPPRPDPKRRPPPRRAKTNAPGGHRSGSGRSRQPAPPRLPPDVWGGALVVAGALAALGVYTHLIGPTGRGIDQALENVFGVGKVLVPPALAIVGVRAVRDETGRRPGRLACGSVLALVATAGLADDLAGPTPWNHQVAALRSAGGLLGAAVGVPLRAGLATWGAGFILVLVAVLAVLVLTATPLRVAAGRVAQAAAGVAGMARTLRHRAARRASADGAGNEGDVRERRDPVAEGPSPKKRSKRSFDPHGPATVATGGTAGHYGAADPGEEPKGPGDAASVPIIVPLTPAEEAAAAERATAPASGTGGDVDPEQLRIALGPAAEPGRWKLPSIGLLKRSKATEVDQRMVEALGRTLEHALAAHGVETRLVGMTVGPTVTRYELELGPGVKVAKVTNLQRDIAYAMAAADVRILAPIPGRSAIGVEVPNTQRQLVAVGDILASPEAKLAVHPLEVAMGRDIAGRPVLA